MGLRLTGTATIWANIQCNHTFAITFMALCERIILARIIPYSSTTWARYINIFPSSMA